MSEQPPEGDLPAIVKRLEARIAELEGEVRVLSRRHDREEIRAYLFSLARQDGPTGPSRSFRIDVICAEGLDIKTLTRPGLFLDAATITEYFARPSSRVGVIPGNRLVRFLMGSAQRLAGRLARRYGEKLALSADFLREAWFYGIYLELWQLIPARHLARRLAAIHDGDPIILPLDKLTLRYLSHGAELNGVELLYLSAELQRLGVPVAFACSDPAVTAAAVRDGEIRLQLSPYQEIWMLPSLPDMPADPSGKDRAALVGAGIRGIAHLLSEVPNPLKIQSAFVMDPAFGAPQEAAMDFGHMPVALNLPLRSSAGAAGTSRAAPVLSTTLPHSDLGDYLVTLVGGATQAAYARAKRLVERHRLTEAHICDHPFFESALISHAVKEKGGRVVLWPHSFNASMPKFRRPGAVDEVNAVLAPGAELWRNRLPAAQVNVIPNLWLPPCLPPRAAVAGEPVSAVIISSEVASFGRHFLMDRRAIEATFKSLFGMFDRLKPDIRPYYRARSQINLQWLWTLAGRPAPADFPSAPDGPATIDLPNMVFMFVGQLSSALYEGIVRGIPALYVREGDAFDDYLDMGGGLPDCLPTGGERFISEELLRCKDPAYRQAMADRQRAWYEAMMVASDLGARA